MARKGSEEIIWHHGQLIDDHPPQILIAREEDVDVRVLQGPLPSHSDVSSCVQGVPAHCMGNPVLEGHAEEFVLVLPLECFGEEAGDPLDHLALARSGRAVAEAEERLLRFCPRWVCFLYEQPFFFQAELLKHAISYSIEH